MIADPTTLRRQVWQRQECRCAACGGRIRLPGQLHHRLTRRHGADCPCNLVLLHAECHVVPYGVHGEPEYARLRGLIIGPSTIDALAANDRIPPGQLRPGHEAVWVPIQLPTLVPSAAGGSWATRMRRRYLRCDGTISATAPGES